MPEPGLYDLIKAQVARYFAAHGAQLPPAGLYYRLLPSLEIPLIEEALKATGGNQRQAAQLLGINRNTLHKKMTQYGLITLDETAAKKRTRPRHPAKSRSL